MTARGAEASMGAEAKLAHRLLPDAALTLLARVAGLLAQVVAFVIIARTHTLAAVGLYAILNTALLLSRLLGPLGLDYAAYRYCSEYLEAGAWDRVKGFTQAAVRRVTAVCCGLTAATLTGAVAVGSLGPEWHMAATLAALFAIGMPAYALIGVWGALHRARGNVAWAQLPEGLIISTVLGIGVAASASIGVADVRVTGALQVGSAWIALALTLLRWRQGLPAGAAAMPAGAFRPAVEMGRRVLAGIAVTQVANRGPILIVSALLGPAATGLYEAAYRFGTLSSLTTYAGNAAAAPLMARALARRDRRDLQNLYTLVSLVQTLSALAVVLALLVAGRWLLAGLLGPAYADAYWPAVLLALMCLANAMGAAASPFVMMSGDEGAITRYSFYSFLAVLALVPPGAWLAGLAGAAAGCLLAVMVRDVGLAWHAARVHGVRPGMLSWSEIGRAGRLVVRLLPELMKGLRRGRIEPGTLFSLSEPAAPATAAVPAAPAAGRPRLAAPRIAFHVDEDLRSAARLVRLLRRFEPAAVIAPASFAAAADGVPLVSDAADADADVLLALGRPPADLAGKRLWRLECREGHPRASISLLEETAAGGVVLAYDAPAVRPADDPARVRARLDDHLPQLVQDALERLAAGAAAVPAADRPPMARPVRTREVRRYVHRLCDPLSRAIPRAFRGPAATRIVLMHGPSPDILDEMLTALGRLGPFTDLDSVVGAMRRGRTPPPGFVVTFDDGRKQNLLLLDVLDRHGCRAVFYVSTASIASRRPLWFMHEGRPYRAHKAELKQLDYWGFRARIDACGLTAEDPLHWRFGLTPAELRTIAARGHGIGIHTVNHPFLTRLDADEIREEVGAAHEFVRSALGTPSLPLDFAYPDGNHDGRVIEVLRSLGARTAATIEPGDIGASTDPMALPRCGIDDTDYAGNGVLKQTPLFWRLRRAAGAVRGS